MSNTCQCCICSELINLKSEEHGYLDDLPVHLECLEQERGDTL